MNASRVAWAMAALVLCATCDVAIAGQRIDVQYRAPDPGDARTDAPRGRERTPLPRPIVPPEGQQENPALREECAWLGQRIVSLLFRDDPAAGNDFIPFYRRFNCPPEHISKAFGCVVSSGSAENDVLAERVALCWTDPAQRPAKAVPAADAAEKESSIKDAPSATGKSADGTK
jgi:hypothetical protein